MTLFETVMAITSMGLAVVIFMSAMFNVHSLTKFQIPEDSDAGALKRVLFIRNLMSLAVSLVFLRIMYLHLSTGILIFNEWYMVFHYIIFVILYVDTCAIRVYLNIEKKKLTKVRCGDYDLSCLSQRGVI